MKRICNTKVKTLKVYNSKMVERILTAYKGSSGKWAKGTIKKQVDGVAIFQKGKCRDIIPNDVIEAHIDNSRKIK